MSEGGPKTLPYARPAPQLGPWFDSSKSIVVRAAALKGLPLARGRVRVFQILVYELNQRETDTTTTVADLFDAAFDDRSGAVFWRGRLSMMTTREEFIAMLLPHLTAQNSDLSRNRLLLDDLVSNDLPASGLLSEGRFDPLPVVKWIGAREGYEDMLPTSLHAFLDRPVSTEKILPREDVPSISGVPGRPTSAHLVKRKLSERASRQETLKTCKAEAEWLSDWLQREHPSVPQVGAHRLQTVIAKEYRKIPKSIPK